MNVMTEASVYEVYDAMSDGEKQHMANKLYKNGWVPQKIKAVPDEIEIEGEVYVRKVTATNQPE